MIVTPIEMGRSDEQDRNPAPARHAPLSRASRGLGLLRERVEACMLSPKRG